MLFRIFFATLLALACAYTPLPSAKDELEIRNKLSLYAIALDTKDFALLNQVFTTDVVIDYQVPDTGFLRGLPAVKAYLVKALTGFVTQHAMSSTVVEVVNKAGDVNSTVYLVATDFGQGNLTGSAAFVYGRYLDSWTKQKGELKSKARTLELFVSALDDSQKTSTDQTFQTGSFGEFGGAVDSRSRENLDQMACRPL